MNSDGEHQPIGHVHGLADHVEMAVGDGIERSRKERRSLHGGGLTRVQVNRKAGCRKADGRRGRRRIATRPLGSCAATLRLGFEDAKNAGDGCQRDEFFRYSNAMRQTAEFVTAITVKFPRPREIWLQIKSNHNASSYFL